MPNNPPTKPTSKHGSTSLLLVLLVYALQVIYLPAHLALEDHHSVWEHYVVAAEHENNQPIQHHGDCTHGADVGCAVAENYQQEHQHGDDHEHGCGVFVQRQVPIQKRFVETVALPEDAPVVAVRFITADGIVPNFEELQLRTLPRLALGSRGPPAVV
ncbi:MAG: hypothetical protein H8E15_14130 [Planctomycetes bacterium]|nr:hypothetical protein [Planctomycetota bacterium]